MKGKSARALPRTKIWGHGSKKKGNKGKLAIHYGRRAEGNRGMGQLKVKTIFTLSKFIRNKQTKEQDKQHSNVH